MQKESNPGRKAFILKIQNRDNANVDGSYFAGQLVCVSCKFSNFEGKNKTGTKPDRLLCEICLPEAKIFLENLCTRLNLNAKQRSLR